MMFTNRKIYGFTLIEVLIAALILGILLSIAVPTYMTHVRKGYRTNAIHNLIILQLAEEKYHYANQIYSSGLTIPPTDRYDIAISNVSATTYTLTATATGGQANDGEGGVSCATLTLAVDSGDETKSPAECWD